MSYTQQQQHLLHLAKNNDIPASHVAYLQGLKNSGFEPKVIYDIGCCVGNWAKEAIKIWPDATYVYFDAYDKVEFMYTGKLYHIGVLTHRDKYVVKFHQNDGQPGGNSYFREVGHPISRKLFPENDFVLKVGMTLDTIVKDKKFPAPDLIKIDVQGAEKDVVAGAVETMKSAQHLIVEMQKTVYNHDAPLVGETLPFIESFGWTCSAPLFCDNGPDGDYGFTRS